MKIPLSRSVTSIAYAFRPAARARPINSTASSSASATLLFPDIGSGLDLDALLLVLGRGMLAREVGVLQLHHRFIDLSYLFAVLVPGLHDLLHRTG